MDGKRDNTSVQKQPIETLSKEEIIIKYKGLLNIAKKAKQAKDELANENRLLKESLDLHETQKEADKNALLTMKEMLEAYTENKLQLSTQVSDLQKQQSLNAESMEQMSIENESLKRQIKRLTDDNEALLTDLEGLEKQLQQVNVIGKEQKQHLELLELEVNKLNEAKSLNEELNTKVQDSAKALEELNSKYNEIKEINLEQCERFSTLKGRLVEVQQKLKELKDCNRVLGGAQRSYAKLVMLWTTEMNRVSLTFCSDDWKTEFLEELKNNWSEGIDVSKLAQYKAAIKIRPQPKRDDETLRKSSSSDQVEQEDEDMPDISGKLNELLHLSTMACEEYETKVLELREEQDRNERLQNEFEARDLENAKKRENLQKTNEELQQQLTEERTKLAKAEQIVEDYRKECVNLRNQLQLAEEEKILEKEHLQCAHDELQRAHDTLKVLENEKLNLLKEIQDQTPKQSLKDIEKILADTQQNLEELQQRYAQKEREHIELLDEMRELNEALKSRGDLISRQQAEQQQLHADLSENAEKMRQIEEALNAKDRILEEKQAEISEISEEIEGTRSKLETLEVASSRNEEQVRVLSAELQTLRKTDGNQTFDLDNESDVLSTSTSSRIEELNRLREVDESYEEKYNKLRGLAAKLKKRLQDQTAHATSLEQKLEEMKHINIELEAMQQQRQDLQHENDELKGEIRKLRSSRKQANVLNLEIEAAEKSLSEVTSKLAIRTNELDAAQEALRTKEATITQLRKEMELVESAREAECAHSKDLKEQIDHLQATLKDTVHAKQLAFDSSKQSEQAHEAIKLKLKSVQEELANCSSEHEVALAAVEKERLELANRLATAQEKLQTAEGKLKAAESAAEDLRVEYMEYKIKAQAVLRKNQNRDTSQEQELKEELATLRVNEKRLQDEVRALGVKLEASEKQREQLVENNANMQQRSKELMQLIDELRQQNARLVQETQSHVQQQQVALKQHRQQIESMDACHKEQLQALAISHQRQLEQLRVELSASVRVPPTIGAISGNVIAQPLSDEVSGEQNRTDFQLMEREDAEGSEEAAEALATLAATRKISNASTSRRSQHDCMPLDELLNTPINAINSETLLSTQPSLMRMDESMNADLAQLELHVTKERLHKQESRVRHLTALLAENEQDLAKLTQMNDMLKEELRRQERSVEREQHMHNSEYLKNVIMKFLTLNNVDERIRLVPVLNTILKLSRTEADMLNSVARGQKVSTDSGGRGGWGNFLHVWGSSNNNN